MSTPLLTRLRSLIEADGPLRLDHYMRLCLADPAHGYYTTRKPIGRAGDFITAPEVSQLFGELVGVWVIDMWQKLGAPDAFILAEAGPGRGTLMADMLRTVKKLAPDCAKAAAVRLIEISPSLRDAQQTALRPFGIPVGWHETVEDIGGHPFLLIANEFLDALPIRQYQFANERWAERTVGLSADNALAWGLKPANFQCPPELDPQEGAIFETCEAAQRTVAHLCALLRTFGGGALFIDYGHLESGFGDTFQAVKDHAYTDPLDTPGEADLTAHVDFDALCRIAKAAGLDARTGTQGGFLLKMGLLERAGALGAMLHAPEREKIGNDVERLAAPEKMGNLFKVMAITTGGIAPYGF